MYKNAQEVFLEYVQRLASSHLVAGTWGNISMRIEKEIMITPSGIPYAQTTVDDLVVVDMNGTIKLGTRKPSSEMLAHIAIYKKYPDWHAIIHTHSIFASAHAAAHRPIPTFIEDHAQIIGGDIEVSKYALPGTQELAKNIIVALGDKNAVLLANHGLIACGTSLAEAFMVAEVAEKSAQISSILNNMGGGMRISEQDIMLMRSNYLNNYKKLQEIKL